MSWPHPRRSPQSVGGAREKPPPPPGTPLAIDAGGLFLRELEVHASWSAGPDDMRAAHELLWDGRVDVAPLLTHRFELADTGAALAAQRNGEAIKAVVVPGLDGAAA